MLLFAIEEEVTWPSSFGPQSCCCQHAVKGCQEAPGGTGGDGLLHNACAKSPAESGKGLEDPFGYIFLYFFCFGEEKGESEAPGGGGGDFLGLSGGWGRVFAGNWGGGGGAKYFFRGPEIPTKKALKTLTSLNSGV